MFGVFLHGGATREDTTSIRGRNGTAGRELGELGHGKVDAAPGQARLSERRDRATNDWKLNI